MAAEPMTVGYYQIIWNNKLQKFEVKYIQGGNVLYSDPSGKNCHDWCIARQLESKKERERKEKENDA